MCVVSMVMEHYLDRWKPYGPSQLVPLPNWRWTELAPPIVPLPNVTLPPTPLLKPVTQEEVDEFRRLLERAREYDRRNNEPDCELDAKRQALKQIAEGLGVDISFIDTPEAPA